MKAILEFDLPEDAVEHRVAIEAMDWRLVVSNLDNFIRQARKHGHHLKNADHALESMHDILHEEMDSRNLTLH